MSTIMHLPLDGKEVMAWVKELEPKHRNIYRVVFHTEYENVFYKDVENGRWIERDLGYTNLAEQIGKRISHRFDNHIHVPKLLQWHNEFAKGKIFRFGFISFFDGEQRCHEVYDESKRYLYTLIEAQNGTWEMLGNTDYVLGNTDHYFLDEVIRALSVYSENT